MGDVRKRVWMAFQVCIYKKFTFNIVKILKIWMTLNKGGSLDLGTRVIGTSTIRPRRQVLRRIPGSV